MVAQGVRRLREVARPEALAERIRAEHRACKTANSAVLEHALAAGELLVRAKDGIPHGSWRAWVEGSCGFSLRTAQVYMHLARRRDEVEEAKAQSAAPLSIEGVLRVLGQQTTPEREQDARRRAEERREQRLNERAEYALRTGNYEPPADVQISPGAWDQVLYQATQLRARNIPNVIDALGHELRILLRHARPEEVGRYLAEPGNDYDDAEARALLAKELREGAAWLARVIEEAERAHGAHRG